MPRHIYTSPRHLCNCRTRGLEQQVEHLKRRCNHHLPGFPIVIVILDRLARSLCVRVQTNKSRSSRNTDDNVLVELKSRTISPSIFQKSTCFPRTKHPWLNPWADMHNASKRIKEFHCGYGIPRAGSRKKVTQCPRPQCCSRNGRELA